MVKLGLVYLIWPVYHWIKHFHHTVMTQGWPEKLPSYNIGKDRHTKRWASCFYIVFICVRLLCLERLKDHQNSLLVIEHEVCRIFPIWFDVLPLYLKAHWWGISLNLTLVHLPNPIFTLETKQQLVSRHAKAISKHGKSKIHILPSSKFI